ncbi:hypothetical protein AB3N59_19660 [Leptospira sp. WS92.C1]
MKVGAEWKRSIWFVFRGNKKINTSKEAQEIDVPKDRYRPSNYNYILNVLIPPNGTYTISLEEGDYTMVALSSQSQDIFTDILTGKMLEYGEDLVHIPDTIFGWKDDLSSEEVKKCLDLAKLSINKELSYPMSMGCPSIRIRNGKTTSVRLKLLRETEYTGAKYYFSIFLVHTLRLFLDAILLGQFGVTKAEVEWEIEIPK